MGEIPAEGKLDRDTPKRAATKSRQADPGDDAQEGRLLKRSRGYDGTGQDESIPLEEAEAGGD